MIKNVMKRVWAFDLEWVPDPLAGRMLYDLPEDSEDADAIRVMWEKGGATEEDPTPFLKTAICRVVSVAALERRELPDGSVKLNLMSLPRDPADPRETSESSVVGTFLDALGKNRPQIVGFNSLQSDLKILIQRGLVLGLSAPGFCERPDKPWEGIDYFARGSDWNIDLKDIVGGWGLASPSLHEIAVQSGIPGKMGVDGNDVAPLWLEGKLESVVRYNECDALTTYLVWLRMAHFAGFFDDQAYVREQQLVADLLQMEIASGGRDHLGEYLEAWNDLRNSVEAARKTE
ncbi:MAG: 3'-5' exonuclease [Acidobacteria bacterium]|jgi:predicted PolB exonuclease-like 3'-5' exonuclease|nr:3'-5' exonuclease [Acidobacteriota bacterium]